MGRVPGGDAARVQRLGGVSRLTDEEICWLVGFLEAEACFRVEPNNGGKNWRPAVTVRVRDDDGPLLLSLHERTQLGRIRPLKSRERSRAQALWAIDAKLETQVLAKYLRRFPPCGRKRGEVAAWCAAVELLGAQRLGCDASTHTEVGLLAAQVSASKRYSDRREPAALFDSDALALAYFGGLFTGDGHLNLSGERPRLVMRMRADERPLLEALARRYGAGAIYDAPAAGCSGPSSQWVVTARAQLQQLAALLGQAGLGGRKHRQFLAWRLAVDGVPEPTRLRAAKAAMRIENEYRRPSSGSANSGRGNAAKTYRDVLRTWAASTAGPLTCTAYAAARRDHPEWPTRGTLVLNFGSWAEALDAAGLRHRAHARSAA